MFLIGTIFCNERGTLVGMQFNDVNDHSDIFDDINEYQLGRFISSEVLPHLPIKANEYDD